MPHNIDLILTLTGGLTAALLLGFITQKLKMSPLVGYLLAGILVGPFSPGYVANSEMAAQFAEIGVILLMFGVGLHFHLKDLIAVQKIALPGAIVQIAASTGLGMLATHLFGWTWQAGAIFGVAISVASTVVLTRILSDNNAMHTPTGHVAIGWLVVEDLFTILALVLLPVVTMGSEGGSLLPALGVTIVKIGALVAFTLIVGQKLIPLFLGYVARTGTRDLFTLAVLALALGIAVGSAKFFGASMALGAFLAGMVVGQSDFSARAASEALPMRDAFAVLFFVSVGMLFDPSSIITDWPLILTTTALVIIGKPFVATAVVLLFKRPMKQALSVAAALAQIGEFSFILAAMAISYGLMPAEANNAIIAAAIISITINPLIYRRIAPFSAWLEKKGLWKNSVSPLTEENGIPEPGEDMERIIVIGYGPVGRNVSRILRQNQMEVAVIEMNIDTVKKLRSENLHVIHGDAGQHEVLMHAGADKARGIIITSSSIDAKTVSKAAKEINPNIMLVINAAFLRDAKNLKDSADATVFSGEGEVAIAMSMFLMREFGATEEQIESERRRIRAEMREGTA